MNVDLLWEEEERDEREVEQREVRTMRRLNRHRRSHRERYDLARAGGHPLTSRRD